MDLSFVELFGYAASALVAFSLTRSSIIKLRWYNLFGSSSFCLYGVLIDAYPVAVLNGFIALTNIFFLRKMLTQTEDNFSILRVNRPSNYVDFFLDYHKQEIEQFFPKFMALSHDKAREYFFLTERTDVVGVLSGYRKCDKEFVVDFDFVVPAYRDFRLGQFVLGEGQELRTKFNFDRVVAVADSKEHQHYLTNLGYKPDEQGIWQYNAK